MTPVLFFVGFASILSQVVLLREMVVSFHGSELIALASLSAWMIWTAAGAVLGRRGDAVAESLALWFVPLGLLVPATAFLARGARLLLGATPGAFVPFGRQIVFALLAVAPVALLFGFLFVRAARRAAARGSAFASSYGIESWGGVAGGIVSALLLSAGAPALGTLLLLGSAAVVAASLSARLPVAARLLVRAAGAALFALVLFGGNGIDRATTRWNFPGLVESRDSPYGRITLTERENQIVLFESGALAFDTESVDAEMLVHPALLQRERFERILLIGGSASGAAREARKHRPASLVVVETDPVLPEMAARRFPPDLRFAPEREGERLVVADGRRAVRGSRREFDAILVDMPEPESGAANRFYTREFFLDCASALRPGGLLAFRLPSAEQLWTPLLERRNGSVHRALASAFENVVVLPGEVDLYLASDAALEAESAVLERRLEARNVETHLVNGAWLRYLYGNDRFASTNRTLRESRAPENRDGRPICYSFTILLWLSRFHRPIAGAGPPSAAWLLLLVPVFVLLLLALGGSRRLADPTLVAAAGFAGIVVEFAVLLRFQTSSGVLYRDIGLLLAGFMAGLAVSPAPGRRAARARGGMRLLLLALALHAAFTVLFFRAGGARSPVASFAWLFLGGTLVGAVFCSAAERARASGGALYAADLIGGGAGAIAGTLILLPLLGQNAAVLSAAGLALLALYLDR